MPRVNSASMPAQPVFLSGLRPHIWEGIGRPDSRPAVTRLVVAGSDAGFRLILSNSVDAICSFGMVPNVPARDEGARYGSRPPNGSRARHSVRRARRSELSPNHLLRHSGRATRASASVASLDQSQEWQS